MLTLSYTINKLLRLQTSRFLRRIDVNPCDPLQSCLEIDLSVSFSTDAAPGDRFPGARKRENFDETENWPLLRHEST